MVRDLAVPVEVIGVPTVRESDGLALSSRNQYLDDVQRAAAPVLYRALTRARELAQNGERDPERIRTAALDMLAKQPEARVQYFALVNADMQPVTAVSKPTYAALAVFFGTTRLIDNIRCL